MTIPRVFVSYAFNSGIQSEDLFTTRLVNDLRAAGAEVVVDETNGVNDDFAQSLNQVLPNCHWLVLVQTPAALHSPRVQLAVNTALNLVVQKRMRAILPIIAAPYDSQEVPATWATLNTYDATQDYQRALMRILLVLGLSPLPNGKEAAPLTRSRDSLFPSSMDRPTAFPEQFFTTSAKFSSSSLDRPERLPLQPASFGKNVSLSANQLDRPTSLPTLPSPTRRKRRQWFTALAVAAVLVLIIAGVAVAANPFSSRRSPVPTATIYSTATTAAIAAATAQTRPTATATTIAQTRSTATATTTAQTRPTATATATTQTRPTVTATATTPPTTGPTPPPPPPTPTPTPVPVQKTYAEQEGHYGANTFTNPYNASGMGSKIPAAAWVQVLCKVYAPAIQSANPDGYWYRIASSPWNNTYYAAANTFMNGDPWGGPYTHNTDFNVPNC